jgi:8-oxo-dGTP pyrophosphatase MutT (NUDIX family)
LSEPDVTTTPRASNIQYAALPWRKVKGKLEFLLITTSNARLWIVPKGWPIEGLTPSQSAAQEAFEEAGLEGEIAAEPLGSFRHYKQAKSGETILCTVHLFPMEVTGQRETWPEKHLRQTCWCSVREALARIKQPNLRRLITKFVRSSGQQTMTA